jgi:dethiobiotin synthetase
LKLETNSHAATGPHPPLKGIFIAGTDTAVGKTVIAGAIARALSSEGVDVGVMKPIETGCRRGKGGLVPADGIYLKAAARSTDSIGSVTPYRYRDPLAPYAASLREKKKVHLGNIVKAYDRLRRQRSFLIVEGVGGLMVPLTNTLDLIDLILLLDLPVLLVGRSGLGTLNHTLLTLRFGSEHGVRFIGIILNQLSPGKTLADKTNPEVLEGRINVPLAGPFPYFKKTGIREKDIERSKTLFMNDLLMKEMVFNWMRSGEKNPANGS